MSTKNIMNIAEKLFHTIIKKNSNEEAKEMCRNHKYFSHEDKTEGVNNYTTQFFFKDDSLLFIDTENFVYADTHNEETFVPAWNSEE
jgi:hypothetical protein